MEHKSNEDDDIELRSLITNWGLTHSTLEEVFMKVFLISSIFIH